MFKAVIEQPKLFKALRDIASSVGRGKGDNPSDACVYMHAYNENNVGKLKLVGSDFREWTSFVLDTVGPVSEGEAPLVLHRSLTDIVGTIPASIEITLEECNVQLLTINYTGRKSPIELPALMAGSYVTEPKSIPTATYQIPADILKPGVEKASRVIAERADGSLLSSVNITLNPNNILFECYDNISKQAMIYAVNHANTVTGSFFVDCGKLKASIANLDSSKDIGIEIGQGHIVVKQDTTTATLPKMFGNYPSIIAHFPQKSVNMSLIIKEDLVNAIRRIQAMYTPDSKTRLLQCSFEGMAATLTANLVKGRNTEIVGHTLHGDEFEATFPIELFMKAIQTIDAPVIEVHCYDTGRISLSPNAVSGIQHRLMVSMLPPKKTQKTA